MQMTDTQANAINDRHERRKAQNRNAQRKLRSMSKVITRTSILTSPQARRRRVKHIRVKINQLRPTLAARSHNRGRIATNHPKEAASSPNISRSQAITMSRQAGQTIS